MTVLELKNTIEGGFPAYEQLYAHTPKGKERLQDAADRFVSVFGEGGELLLTRPGTYEVTQTGMNGKPLAPESFFVRIPTEESNPDRLSDSLPHLLREEPLDTEFKDIILYLSIALFTLMLAEWALEIKKNY